MQPLMISAKLESYFVGQEEHKVLAMAQMLIRNRILCNVLLFINVNIKISANFQLVK